TDLGLSGTLSANAGTRGQQGGTARLNYQKGRFTLFGGGSFSLSRNDYTNSDLRENRITDPVTFLQQSAIGRNDRGYGGADVTVEWKLTPRSTIWSGMRTNLNASGSDVTTNVLHMDALRDPTDRYDRIADSESDYFNGYGTLGFRRVVEAQRNEFSVEL